MPYRTQLEKEKVKASLELSVEEYKQAILDYLVRNKMLPEGVDISTVAVSQYASGGTKVKPKIEYTKEVIKLYDSE